MNCKNRKTLKLSFSSYHKATQNCLSQTLSYLLKRKIPIFLYFFFSFFYISSLQQLRFVAYESAAIYFLCQNNIYIVHENYNGAKAFIQLILCFHKKTISRYLIGSTSSGSVYSTRNNAIFTVFRLKSYFLPITINHQQWQAINKNTGKLAKKLL